MSDDFITINSSDKFIRRIRSICILIYMYMIYGRRVAIYSTIRDNETKTHYNLARRRTDSLRRNQLAICRRMSATRHSSPPQRLPQGAIDQFDIARHSSPTPTQDADIAWGKAIATLREGNIDSARGLLQKYIKAYPATFQTLKARIALADCDFYQGALPRGPYRPTMLYLHQRPTSLSPTTLYTARPIAT